MIQESGIQPSAGESFGKTELLFVNHASVLIRRGSSYLLTDPWHQKPAFGSWLPTFPPYVHPAYLSSLGENLTILISHGHDDHCDDELLSIFARNTPIVTAAYMSPSVRNRMKKLGFLNITTADSNGSRIANGFLVRSFINPSRSLDDAIYTIDTGSALVIHCNDNWQQFDAPILEGLMQERKNYDAVNIAFLSQTNSASGYPLNYRNFEPQAKREILTQKVRGMILQGLRNADALGLRTFCSYAGYASVFVKGKPEYLEWGLVPTAKFIREQLLVDAQSQELMSRIQLLDFYPGDILNLATGELQKAFVRSGDYTDQGLRGAAHRYYQRYGIVQNCDSFRALETSTFDEIKLDYFLDNLNRFAVRKLKTGGEAFASVLDKSFEIVIEDLSISRRIVFGKGLTETQPGLEPPNKRMIVQSAVMTKVLDGEILFENLYTGYEAEWERHPADSYNRDIVMFIVMYSYVYMNVLSREFPGTRA